MSADQSDLAAYSRSEITPDGAYICYEQCENIVPENGRICGPCFNEPRAADRKRRKDVSRS